MSEKLLKGFSLTTTLAFIDSHYTHEQREQIHARLTPELRNMTSGFKPGDWYPIEYQTQMLRAMASVAEEPTEAHTNAVALGRFLSDQASNTFMRLLFKVLTPLIFLKKAPAVWGRMFNFGRFETDAADYDNNRVVMLMLDVDGFDYVAPVSEGWIATMFEAVGCKNVAVHATDLEEGTVRGAGYKFDINWSER
jgi:hypothetical protein